MPLYEFECTVCEHVWEKLQSAASNPQVADCIRCGGRGARTATAPAVRFSGNGWQTPKPLGDLKPPGAGGSDGY